MNVYIYTEGVRKVKGEEQPFLSPVAELEDFETVDAALEALVDSYPEFLGSEFVIFTSAPDYITVAEPTAKYSFVRRNGSEVVTEPEEAYEEEEPEYEDEEGEIEVEEEPPPPPTPIKKKPPAKKVPAKKPAAKKAAPKPAGRSGARAGTRTGSSKRTPFTRNPASAD